MRKYLKGELYKFFNGHFIYYSLLLIFLYSILANYLYNDDILLLYKNFIKEYELLFLALSLLYSSEILSDEYEYGTILEFKNNRFLNTKLLVILMYLFLLFIFSFIISFDISIIFYNNFIIGLKVFKNIILEFFGVLPMFIILNLSCILLSIITKKANISLILTFIFYLLSTYFNNFIIIKKLKFLYISITLHWDFTKNILIGNIINKKESLLICIITVLLIYTIVKRVFNKIR